MRRLGGQQASSIGSKLTRQIKTGTSTRQTIKLKNVPKWKIQINKHKLPSFQFVVFQAEQIEFHVLNSNDCLIYTQLVHKKRERRET